MTQKNPGKDFNCKSYFCLQIITGLGSIYILKMPLTDEVTRSLDLDLINTLRTHVYIRTRTASTFPIDWYQKTMILIFSCWYRTIVTKLSHFSGRETASPNDAHLAVNFVLRAFPLLNFKEKTLGLLSNKRGLLKFA